MQISESISKSFVHCCEMHTRAYSTTYSREILATPSKTPVSLQYLVSSHADYPHSRIHRPPFFKTRRIPTLCHPSAVSFEGFSMCCTFDLMSHRTGHTHIRVLQRNIYIRPLCFSRCAQLLHLLDQHLGPYRSTIFQFGIAPVGPRDGWSARNDKTANLDEHVE